MARRVGTIAGAFYLAAPEFFLLLGCDDGVDLLTSLLANFLDLLVFLLRCEGSVGTDGLDLRAGGVFDGATLLDGFLRETDLLPARLPPRCTRRSIGRWRR